MALSPAALRPLAAVGLTMLQAGSAAAATFADGQRAYEAGRFADSGAIWGPLAAAGMPEAQLGLGLLYDLGQGVAVDPGGAYAWYRRAAEAGLPSARFNVAVMEDTGRVVPRNAAQAASWYARAAARGHARAQYNLAQLYAVGDGVPRNPGQAAAWYRAAARGGLGAAADKLAQMNGQAGAARAAPSSAARVGLVSVTPAVPPPDAAITLRAERSDVELAWVAPEQPVPTRFFVEVMTLPPRGSSREVFSAYVDESAALVRLESGPGRYAWRVYSVGDEIARYAVSEWRRFTVEDAG